MPADVKDLVVWQLSIQLAKEAHRLAEKLPDKERFALVDQINRAAGSIPANIAEGHGRGSDREFHKFLTYSRGSLYELETHIILSIEFGYFTSDDANIFFVLKDEVAKKLNAFMTVLKQ